MHELSRLEDATWFYYHNRCLSCIDKQIDVLDFDSLSEVAVASHD